MFGMLTAITLTVRSAIAERLSATGADHAPVPSAAARRDLAPIVRHDGLQQAREFPVGPPAVRELVAARRTTPAAIHARGSYVSAQINQDGKGNNIVGDAANEPSLAIDPKNADRMVVAWRQFDSITSTFRQAGVAYSHDRGQTWPNPQTLDPGQFRSDPVLAADASGVFYFASLSSGTSAEVFRSFDGGVSWSAPRSAFGGDKEWITVDRTAGPGAGNLYMNWSVNFSCCPPADFTRSTDGGFTFNGPFPIGMPSQKWGTMAVGSEGTLYLAGATIDNGVGHVFARSSNAENSGEAPTFDRVVGIDLGGLTVGGGVNPDGLLGQVWLATHPKAGLGEDDLYVLASVFDFNAFSLDVKFIRSVDGGQTWSDPVIVNDDGSGAFHWFGAMSVAPNGRIDATWYDTRNDPVDPAAPDFSEVFYAYSLDGGRTWSPNVPITPAFNHYLGYPGILGNPDDPQQQKLGDYTHMHSDNGGASLAYAATFNGEQDVYFVRIPFDCDGNGVEDLIDINNGANDCNGNLVLDSCEPANDCNANKKTDICEIGSGLSEDCDGNSVPDECQPTTDCDLNGSADICDLAIGTHPDCNGNARPDVCDISTGFSSDSNRNGVPDECQGSCCLCGPCINTTLADCLARDGGFFGNGTFCETTTCTPPPSNDSCLNPIPLAGELELFEPFDNRCASNDGPFFTLCDAGFQPFTNDLWYVYTPPCDGTLTVSLCEHTFFDSILAVYAEPGSCTCPVGNPLTCGDDTCGFGGGPSIVVTPVTGDACHIIRVGGWGGAFGDGGIIVTLTPDFVEPTPLALGLESAPSTTASGFPFGDCDHDNQIDLGDAAAMVGCLEGPGVDANACCRCAALTSDDDVSLGDYAVLQVIFGEP